MELQNRWLDNLFFSNKPDKSSIVLHELSPGSFSKVEQYQPIFRGAPTSMATINGFIMTSSLTNFLFIMREFHFI